jgi:hypothetical protein
VLKLTALSRQVEHLQNPAGGGFLDGVRRRRIHMGGGALVPGYGQSFRGRSDWQRCANDKAEIFAAIGSDRRRGAGLVEQRDRAFRRMACARQGLRETVKARQRSLAGEGWPLANLRDITPCTPVRLFEDFKLGHLLFPGEQEGTFQAASIRA